MNEGLLALESATLYYLSSSPNSIIPPMERMPLICINDAVHFICKRCGMDAYIKRPSHEDISTRWCCWCYLSYVVVWGDRS